MFVNDTNVVELFYSDSRLFDKEGKLFVQCFDKKELSRSYREKLCRLRGNLLLIGELDLERHDSNLLIQLVVLNNFEIQPCDESKHFEFCISINSKSSQYIEKIHFISTSRSERDKWIESIYLASFNFLSSCCKALNSEFMKKIKDIEKICNYENGEINSTSIDDVGCWLDSNLSIVIKCNNILFSSSITPHLYIKVYTRNVYIDKYWKYLGCTEIIQSKSPHFSRCINLKAADLNIIELKFELYNVVEKEFETSYLIAYAYCKIEKRANYLNKDLEINFYNCNNNHFTGKLFLNIIELNFRKLRKSISSSDLTNSNSFFANCLQYKIPRCNSSPDIGMNIASDLDIIKKNKYDLFENGIQKHFVFKVYETNSDVIITENMSESKFVFLIPQILLKLYAQDEENIKRLIEKFYSDNSILKSIYHETLCNFHKNLLNVINESLTDIITFMSKYSFRSSKNKIDNFLQFIPINFHKQSCNIRYNSKSSSISVFTVGAYACHHLGFENGGIKSILTNECHTVIESWTILKKLLKVINCETKISTCLNQIDKYTISFANNDLNNYESIKSEYDIVSILANELIDIISVNEAEILINHLNSLSIGNSASLDEEYQLEPIDLIYLNIKACLVAINYKVSQKQLKHSEIESCNRKLKCAIESLRKTIFACYLSVFSKLTNEQTQLLFKLKFRHLSLFSQALTTLIVFIMDKIENIKFLEQVYDTKYILMEHETLLSCYADELGMIDDMTYALEEVANSVLIVFSFENNTSSSPMPDIETFGDKIRLIFHVGQLSNRSPSLTECKIMSLIFNIGINHHATLADKFGYRSYQDDLNQINFNKLKAFITQFHLNNSTVIRLLDKLKRQMTITNSKNVHILELIELIVRELNGIRVTCCKSAKDRTGMSVTLEEARFGFQCMNLNEDIHSQLFRTILDTLRSNGTRIENVYKNIGTRKYAFNFFQLMTFPAKFKPPSGTYSNVET